MQLSDIGESHLLALLIAGEADGEPLVGQVAVACVVVERLRRKRWGDTLRAVMLQPYQFSTFNDDHWQKFVSRIWMYHRIAELAIEQLLKSPVSGATHYHAVGIAPSWARSSCMKMIGQIGNHVFYRED